MAFALPAAASAISAAAPAAAATAAKATLMTTLKSVAFNALTNLAISTALSVFQPQVGQSGRTFEFVIDPDGPIPFAAGRVGVAGSVIHRDTFGPDLMYYGIPFVLSGAGPITAIESFKADDYPMAFDANGGATTEPYRQELFFRSVLGHQPAPAALTTPSGFKNGATLPGWTSAHKLSGKAAGVIFMAENSKGSAFPTGEIKPLVQMMGLKGWDPTLDSTYPGGSGPCRLHDSSTWVTLTCPILWALKWALGLWEGPTLKGAPAHGSTTDYQVGGIGAKLSGIDVPAFVAASNIAKANGWTVSAYPNTDDDKHQVLQSFLQTGGAIYSQRAGKISCISRAAPRSSIVTISAADTAGPLEIDAAASRIDRINTLRPRFWSPAHRWQMTALDGEVTAESYREEDGAVRSRGIDYPYVSNAVQAAQLAALQIANTREGIAGVIPLKPHLQRIRPGDAFTITEPGFVLNGLKCLCLNTDYDPATGVVRVSFVSETDGKYPFALGQSPTPPTPQVLTPVDPRYVTPPLPIDWTIIPRPGSGAGLPTFDLSGVVSNDTATSILVEFYEVPSGANPNDTPPVDTGWQSAGVWPPTATSIPITVQPDRYYWIGVKYIRNSNYSDRQVWGPYLAGKLLAEVPADDPIWEDLYQSAKDLLKGAIEDAQALLEEERKREIGVADVLDRLGLGLLLDPVERTALIKSETLVEGVGPTGLPETLVQMRTRLVAADAANAASAAQALIDAKVYTDGLRNDAAIAYATYTAMGTAISASAAGVQSWTTAQIAGAVANLVTASQLATSLATAKGQWESYATAAAANAVIGLDTVAAREAALATAKGQWESYASAAAASAVIGLDTVALREAAIAATVLQLRSETTEAITTATATLATQTSLNGVSAIAALALSTANGNEAYAALSVEANGWLTALRVNGVSREIGVVAEVFSLRSSSSGIRSEYRGGVWYIYDPDAGVRTMYGKSFGGSAKLQWWTGPASITEGSETKANAFVYIAMTAPRFGGSDVVASGGLGYTAGSMSVARGTSPTTIATLTSSTSTSLVEVSSTAESDGPKSEAPVVTTYLYGVSGGVETLLASKAMTPGGVGDPITYVFPPVQAAYPTFRVKVRGTGPSSATGIANVDVTLKITPLATA